MMEIGSWVAADQSTGRIVHIPNGVVFVKPLLNYSEEFNLIWNEIRITITFESNWIKAKNLLQEIAERQNFPLDNITQKPRDSQKQKYYFFYTHLTPTVYTSIQEFGVGLTVRYLCEPRNRRGSEQAITEDTLKMIQEENDIKLAYPTRRNLVQLTKSESVEQTQK
jgi:small-conductance mechanosensitive channel